MLCALAALVSEPVVATPAAQPTLMQVDPATIASRFTLTPPTPSLASYGRSSLIWALQIRLPPRVTVQRIDAPGYAPVNLTLSDGRCFTITLDSGGTKLTGYGVRETQNCAGPRPLSTRASPRPGLVDAGKAWLLDAWLEPSTGRTYLAPQPGVRGAGSPVLTTTMKVLGMGGIGGVDVPVTEVSLVGLIDGKLMLVTAMLVC